MNNIWRSRAAVLCILLIELLLTDVLWAENQEKVIVISDKIGELIDVHEREQYNILPAIENFKSAVFLQLPDSSYVLEVTYEQDGKEKTMRISQTFDDLNKMRRFFGEEEWIKVEPEPEPEPKKIIVTPTLQISQNVYSWFTVGVGAGMGGLSGVINFSHQRNARLLSLRYTACVGILGSPPELYEVGLLYGISLKRKYFLTSVAAGIGYIWGEGYDWNEVSTIGIPIETQLFITPLPFCGVGFYIFTNLNREAIPFGIALSLQLGKLR